MTRILAFLRKHWRWLVLALIVAGIAYLLITSAEARHIAERFVLHYICSTALTLIFFFLLRFGVRKSNWMVRYVAPDKLRLLTVSALLVAGLFSLREPWDIYAGNNSIIKSYFDILSWYSGPISSVWGLDRFDRSEDQ